MPGTPARKVTLSTREGLCAAISAAHGEPIHATAGNTRAWLLLEQAGPWAADPLRGAPLGDTVGPLLAERCRQAGVRAVLLRRRSTGGEPGHHVFLAWTGLDGAWMRRGYVRDVADVLAIDLEAVGQGHQPRFGASDDSPLYLVCTHGKKDACCAAFGRPAMAAMAAARPEQSWECSHIGGDRFAGNVVCFPGAQYYGRVDPAAAPRIAEAHERGELLLESYRGRSGLPMPVQAAEWHVRRSLGLSGIDDVEVLDHRTQGQNHDVAMAAGDTQVVARVRPESHGAPRVFGCSRDDLFQPRPFALVSITEDAALWPPAHH